MKFPGTSLPARVVLALLAVAALAVAGCSAVDEATKSDVAKTEVGDCINITDNSPTATEGEPIDCADPKAVYKVHQSFDQQSDCASNEYTSYTEQLASGGTAFLCLAPNFAQDACYNDVGTSPYMWVDCGSTDATFKVLQRVDGETDELLCDQATEFITVSDPKTLFCLGKP
ncbi:hypothetical protein IU433_16415 [Nocardia puris]|uniref:Uncharacterized protein n=1 Tax=Nocardia puris TaxID=208602 RepID=A0A366DA46_9NOCA|nr:hypothetical protein [Nocardia puris]MBF6211736.1 hypothetical protein [Nocardia puris]MBF6365739.1 hypothetical protein [Nocardia puris]MBF6460618.1 hypothetical protein [Nocardia puris]RBO86910.1 hypothetical protein DFR74_11282 [Nocardia puris]